MLYTEQGDECRGQIKKRPHLIKGGGGGGGAALRGGCGVFYK